MCSYPCQQNNYIKKIFYKLSSVFYILIRSFSGLFVILRLPVLFVCFFCFVFFSLFALPYDFFSSFVCVCVLLMMDFVVVPVPSGP